MLPAGLWRPERNRGNLRQKTGGSYYATEPDQSRARLTEELNELDESLDKLTRKYTRNLRNQFGVGPQTAATLLAVAGDNPEHLKNEAALASLCGVNPLPASSGKTVRHRLNRGGSREANNALWTIALVRMRSDPRTIIYVDRRAIDQSDPEMPKTLHRP